MIPAFLFVAILLMLGVVLRLVFPLFRWLYIPASVVAGLLGLLTVQTHLSEAISVHTSKWASVLSSWPGFLIAIVFAGMLLERKPAPWRQSVSRVGRQGLMVWVIVLGETAIGLLATWLLITPFFDVPNSIGTLIETGFAGGHGTAAAMGQVFEHPSIQLIGGLDLGILMATGGLMYGLVSGILWINIAVRRGWVASKVTSGAKPGSPDRQINQPIGYGKIGKDTIDPLLLQVLWLAFALGIGFGLQTLVTAAAGYAESFMNASSQSETQLTERMSLQSIVGSFPLFIYTLFGGWFVRIGLRKLGHEQAIDRETINRLTSTAMDILIVSAITTLNLTAVATLIVPFSILFICGALWTGFCLMVLARRILPREHWFELGLINYGMSTGTTATGFVLLRLVDPELESGAAEDYAMAAPLSSPFIGGGMITIALPLLVLERFPLPATSMMMCFIVVGLILLGQRWNKPRVPNHDIIPDTGEDGGHPTNP